MNEKNLQIILIIFAVVKSKNRSSVSSTSAASRTPQSELMNLASLKQKDPNFSEADFSVMISNLYIRLQNCWAAKNIEELRPYLSDAVYSSADSQLDEYRKTNTTNRIEHPTVLGVDVRGWKSDGEMDSVIVSLRTRIVDYVVRDADDSLLSGSKTAEKFMEYEWELVRSSNTLTQTQQERTVHNCPNCGAPLNINRTAKCEYCGSIITVKEFDWVLNSIKGIYQQTVG